jgi:hypothetical protein
VPGVMVCRQEGLEPDYHHFNGRSETPQGLLSRRRKLRYSDAATGILLVISNLKSFWKIE